MSALVHAKLTQKYSNNRIYLHTFYHNSTRRSYFDSARNGRGRRSILVWRVAYSIFAIEEPCLTVWLDRKVRQRPDPYEMLQSLRAQTSPDFPFLAKNGHFGQNQGGLAGRAQKARFFPPKIGPKTPQKHPFFAPRGGWSQGRPRKIGVFYGFFTAIF